MKNLLLAGLSAFALAASASTPAPARPFTPSDMVGLDRIAAPAVSPDGRWLAYQLRTTDLAGNRGRTDLYLLDLSRAGAQPRRIASTPDHDESAPAFSPDGATLYYLSNASGDDQLWKIAVAGGDATQLTRAPGGIAGFLISPTGDRIALWADRPVGRRALMM